MSRRNRVRGRADGGPGSRARGRASIPVAVDLDDLDERVARRLHLRSGRRRGRVLRRSLDSLPRGRLLRAEARSANFVGGAVALDLVLPLVRPRLRCGAVLIGALARLIGAHLQDHDPERSHTHNKDIAGANSGRLSHEGRRWPASSKSRARAGCSRRTPHRANRSPKEYLLRGRRPAVLAVSCNCQRVVLLFTISMSLWCPLTF